MRNQGTNECFTVIWHLVFATEPLDEFCKLSIHGVWLFRKKVMSSMRIKPSQKPVHHFILRPVIHGRGQLMRVIIEWQLSLCILNRKRCFHGQMRNNECPDEKDGNDEM
jgi:hypothetical protein